MKLRFTLSILTLFCLGILLTSSSNGRAAAAGEGNTGAPGDNNKTCATCHSAGAFDPDIKVDVSLDGLSGLDEYTPGAIHTIDVTMTATGASGYGFQMVALVNDETSTNSWSNPSTNAKIVAASGRDYVEQAGVSDSDKFSIEWTAPEAESGAVTFYLAVNAVNKDNATDGDGVELIEIEIQEGAPSSIADPIYNDAFVLTPNPNYGWLQIEVGESFASYEIYNLVGSLMTQGTFSQGQEQLDIQSYDPGMYLVRAISQDGQSHKTQRLIKQ